MKKIYFKSRKSFDFSTHPYDIGTLLGLWLNHDDNHFLLRMYGLNEDSFDEYYNYHLSYAINGNITTEEDFYSHVWQIVKNRVRHFGQRDPFSSSHAMHINNLHKLQLFQKYLHSIDKWNARPSHLIISEKDELITQQKLEIESLKKQLAELNQYEVAQKSG